MRAPLKHFKSGNGQRAVLAAMVGLLWISAAYGQGQENGFRDDVAALQKDQQFCQVIVRQHGALHQNVDATELSSTASMGLAGRAEVSTSNSSYYVGLDTPLGFSMVPNGGNGNVQFKTAFSGSGATSFFSTPGENRVKLKRGKTDLEVNFQAKKLSGSFPAGQYRADVVLRCE